MLGNHICSFGGLLRRIVAVAVLASTTTLAGCTLHEPPPVSQKVMDYYTNPPELLPDPDLVTIIGDSYTGGSDMGGYGAANWVARAQMKVGRANLDNEGLGGTGYTTGNSFGSRVAPASIGPNTDVVMFVGSRNDLSANYSAVLAAASGAYAEARKLAPDAELVVVGPVWGGGEVPENMIKIRDAVRDAATGAGATWVDPLEHGWFLATPEERALIGEDSVHPTDEGHAYLAEKMLPLLVTALAK